MKISAGIPTFRDIEGLKFTVMGLKQYGPLIHEIVVIDNAGDKETMDFCRSANIRYINYKEHASPALAKNKVVEEATGDVVVILDSHVLTYDLGQLSNMELEKDVLYVAPLLYNDGSLSTHFDNVWRGGMWGTWAFDKENFEKGEPFQVWGSGCGFLICRKDSWIPFDSHVRGFGGEEGPVFYSYKKVMCIPKIRWWHNFVDASKKKNLIRRTDTVRNYVLELKKRNMDITPVYKHFVDLNPGGNLALHLIQEHSVDERLVVGKNEMQLQAIHKQFKITEEQWLRIISDPINYAETMLEQIYNDLEPRDLNQHFEMLASLADLCPRIVDVSRRRESSLLFALQNPDELTTYSFEEKPWPIHEQNKEYKIVYSPKYSHPSIPECDLLFFKCPHQYNTIFEDLRQWAPKIKRFFAIHDTESNGELWVAGDNRPGTLTGLEDFLNENPNWFVYSHSKRQWGLTVLGCQEQDRPAEVIYPIAPRAGVGTELKKIFSDLGLKWKTGCTCEEIMKEMNIKGVEYVEANFDVYVQRLNENKKKYGILDHVVAGWRTFTTGLYKEINIGQPIESTLQLAIQRYKEELANEAKN